MGEYSIFCEDWEEGVSYNQGNIAIYDDRIWVKNSMDYGSIFSEKYKEFYFPQIKDIKHDTVSNISGIETTEVIESIDILKDYDKKNN